MTNIQTASWFVVFFQEFVHWISNWTFIVSSFEFGSSSVTLPTHTLDAYDWLAVSIINKRNIIHIYILYFRYNLNILIIFNIIRMNLSVY